VAALRGELEKGRGLVEAEAVRAAAASIEDLMATAQWNQALAEANRLAESFPKNAEARALLQRVVRERDLYRDSTTRQLWDEVKRQVERRAWRKALAAARRLSEQFPEHKLAQRVQGQLPTIAENAEIEERHEREQEIQNLVGRKRFSDAADLAEELIARFPHSPQAQKLQDMLPMLRQRAAQQSVAR
jgi:outer membrane protein assembly factor BamD (BamD/ComL family)